MRAVEFAAELTILLIEGPQDKKEAIDLYYGEYQKNFKDGPAVEKRLRIYLDWIQAALPELERSRLRKPVDLYALIGALAPRRIRSGSVDLDPAEAGQRLREFERKLGLKQVPDEGARYLIAASRQTDNLRPRLTRISILADVLDS
jgi:hypothetical protein